MVNRLKTLYELQLIDDQLDELEELRGDLPNAVKSLQDKMDGIKEQVSEKETNRKESLKKEKRMKRKLKN